LGTDQQGRKAESVRIGRFLGVLGGAAGTVLAVGCGAQHAGADTSQPLDLAAAVSNTQDQTARIATTVSTTTQGRTVSQTANGVFDFARSRGMITIAGADGMTEVFVPPTTYVKFPDASADSGALPRGKTWLALPDRTTSASGLLAPGGGDPADLLASLTAVSSGVTKIGAATIRGVPVTGFAIKVDPAKAAEVPGADRAADEGLAKTFGATEMPVDVWVDGHNLVRREKLTLLFPGRTGAPAGAHLVMTTDFYDFGVRVQVSAPPASQVATEGSQFASASASAPAPGSGSGAPASGSSASGSVSSGSGRVSATGIFFGTSTAAASPPPVSGTLTAEQAASAEHAVAAFWAALGRGNTAAVAATVLPAQRSCVRSDLGPGAPTISVSSLHITSAQPAGNAAATVRFTVKAEADLGGQEIAVAPQGPGGDQWFSTTEVAGHWYVNISDNSAFALGGDCS
jgi:hypothetical protein